MEGQEKPSPAPRERHSEDSLGADVSAHHRSPTEQGVLGMDAGQEWEGDESQADVYTCPGVGVAFVGAVRATAEDSWVHSSTPSPAPTEEDMPGMVPVPELQGDRNRRGSCTHYPRGAVGRLHHTFIIYLDGTGE